MSTFLARATPHRLALLALLCTTVGVPAALADDAGAPPPAQKPGLLPRLKKSEADKRKSTNKEDSPYFNAPSDEAASAPAATASQSPTPAPAETASAPQNVSPPTPTDDSASDAAPEQVAPQADAPADDQWANHRHHWRHQWESNDDSANDSAGPIPAAPMPPAPPPPMAVAPPPPPEVMGSDEAEQEDGHQDSDALEDEGGRSRYLAQTAGLPDDEAKAQALVRLLTDAPITEQTGREVLRIAGTMRQDGPKALVLGMMDRIQESALIRGPLANQYLGVAAQLKSPDALADALTHLLHPTPVSRAAVMSALALTQRISDAGQRLRVLREVTDHQQLSPDVVVAYQGLVLSLGNPSARAEAVERLAEARHQNVQEPGRGRRLDDEGDRSQYIASIAGLDDDAKSEALVRLLRDAPISERTGHEVLQSTSTMREDVPKAAVLEMMHHIRESNLVRGPLAMQYLGVAAQLRSPDALADALTNLLHPEKVPHSAVLRALELANRIQSAGQKLRVLREVTDHQRLDPDVVAAYEAVSQTLTDRDARAEAQERLASAGDPGDGESGGQAYSRRMHGWNFNVNVDDGWRDQVEQATQMAREQAREQMDAQRDQLRDQVQRVRDQARHCADAWREKSQEIKEQVMEKFRGRYDNDSDDDNDEDD